MERSNIFLSLLIGMMTGLQAGVSLKCYDCDSITNSDCNNISPDSDKYLKDCTIDKIGIRRRSPVCYQAHGTVNLMIAEGEALIRGCADKPLTENGCGLMELPYRFAGLECKICAEDRCNGDYISTAGPALRVTTASPANHTKGGAGGSRATIGLLLFTLGWFLFSNLS